MTTEVAPDLDTEVTSEVARALYFSIAELLTNTTKHARAESVSIQVTVVPTAKDGAIIRIRTTDDGRGGARPRVGHGLAGLHDRITGLRGTLRINSPQGGPTVVDIEVPAGSGNSVD
ncbi:ATP-binding protein [Actinomycetaceae bacterium MB13-C1-2]|nr:ATP-binding protein [Actinomycetaceae bacterium MB13-C1-2]